MIAGALLMTLGHVVLGIDTNSTFSLYLALAIIICGYGLFKSNISCLLGELYDENDHRRDGGFSLLYAAGNIGSIAAPIACGLAAQWYGWHVGFALAGGGMFIGLLIFLSGHQPGKVISSPRVVWIKKRSLASNLPYQYGAG
ncbi:hypothetical protein EIMP300_88760 [Escherichia coli]|uniref:Major facilitator superfamily (MFS) profile domain-containing protein n=1 Tax=Escherichia coli TaxID=562 RepID=A0A8S0G3W8_ECOLX|nr:hypothetical protein EIMP300_88760 [Escherichia coli]